MKQALIEIGDFKIGEGLLMSDLRMIQLKLKKSYKIW